MGKLRDELAKHFGTPRDKPTKPAGRSKSTPTALESTASGSARILADWKAGVTPLNSKSGGGNAAGELRRTEVKPQTSSRDRSTAVSPRRQPRDLPRGPRVTEARGRQPGSGSAPSIKAPSPEIARTAKSPPSGASPPDFGTMGSPSLAREREFRFPEDWVSKGAFLQPPGGRRGRTLPVRIGIDFGSAYTKVAIRAADRVFFVPWDGVRRSEARYLLPGEVARTGDGAAWLGRAQGAEIRSNLKLPFVVRGAHTRDQLAATVAFLAWVMRYARGWLYKQYPGLLRDRTLAWQVNLGCPASSWSTNDFRSAYLSVGTRAWQLSQASDGIAWDAALDSLAHAIPKTDDIGLDSLSLLPEFVAQIAGYVRSPQRINGLHFLMDVGAGTVDLATFNVGHTEIPSEDLYSIFASEVKPLGTHFLMEARVRHADPSGGPWDDLQVVPSPAEVAARLRIDETKVREADEAFVERVASTLKSVLDYTHTKRYGKAPEWRQGLPAFLAGGGADCEIYSCSLARGFAKHGVKLKRTPFPLLQAVEGASDGNFHRLSVAYGLTIDPESVGAIRPPHEIADAPQFDPLVDTAVRDRPDRDDLYPK